jgi:AAHS family 4-hydroxybenzoate transporter-like MFS transporter
MAQPSRPAGEEPAFSTIDIASFIDQQPVGSPQIALLLMCAAVLFTDGFDTQAIGFVAPALVQNLGLSRAALGPVFSAGLFGLMIGALTLGPLADRVGRKRIILFSVIAFGLCSLAAVFAHDTTTLLLMRFLTGLGLGGAMPNAVALTSEFSPRNRRATMVMAMFVGFSVGAALGGLIAAALIPSFGWRSVFVIGGIAPLLLAPFLARDLPESVRFVKLAGGSDARVASLLALVFPKQDFPKGTRFSLQEAQLRGLSVAHLFGEGRATGTVLLWVVFFASLLDLYFLSNWLPTLLNDLGASVSVAAIVGAMFQVGGVVGTFTLGRFVDRFSFRALALTYLLAAIALAALGASGHSIALAAVIIFLAGFCIVGAQIAANALAAEYYPTSIRSTGVGWALGIGRVGSIIGPLVGGALLVRHWETQSLFLAAAAPAICGALAALVLARIAPAGKPASPAQAGQPTMSAAGIPE